MTQKKFFTAAQVAELALGYLYVRQFVLKNSNKKSTRYVQAAELPPIEMNGGL